MSEIKYVCISDLHLGQEQSLFANLRNNAAGGVEQDYGTPGECLNKFIECLKDLKSTLWLHSERPILVLNGDLLELALCKLHNSLKIFQCFLKGITDAELFRKIVYIPGNHDHHLWEMTREDQYFDFLMRNEEAGLPQQWHTTKMFAKRANPLIPGDKGDPVVVNHLLDGLIKRSRLTNPIDIEIRYPNFGVLNDDQSKCVIFHHGHFVECIYTLITDVNDWIFPGRGVPRHVWNLETENFAWIDFVWSALGQGNPELEVVYDKRLNEKKIKEVFARISSGIVQEFRPGFLQGLKAEGIKESVSLLYHWLCGLEKSEEVYLSDRSTGLLRKYLEISLAMQIRYDLICLKQNVNDLREQEYTPEKLGEMIEELPNTTFVFGHTHKPFCGHYRSSAYSYGNGFDVYNTGGWVVEDYEKEPCHGAAVALVNDQLDTVLLNIYNEEHNNSFFLESTKFVSEATSGFLNEMKAKLNRRLAETPWTDLAKDIEAEMAIRKQNLLKRVSSPL